ncbi:histidine kinase [Pararhizobium mangrovi]|uniref:Histidine kinase n=1 Tax=Pararhizobium mangrovi TaxID=2590452 RepID=A0A506TZ11_9HYPH|nr:histidine kinase [Pararhizobium mangrovi]TPW27322.1 histidine kinase [Pararhizobium mangrovi]
MPSLIRFVVFCAVVAALAYGAMFALVLYVQPKPREITVHVPTPTLDDGQNSTQQ